MTQEKKHNFQKLTPSDNVGLGIYRDALNYVFSDDNCDVKNIAVSGAYGAGKSSILATYKKENANLKFIHISLAHFEPCQKGTLERESKEYHNTLEGKILNQLIHQIPADKISLSNFKIKKNYNESDVQKNASSLTFLIFSLLYFVYFKQLSQYVFLMDEGYIKSFFEFMVSPLICLVLIISSLKNIDSLLFKISRYLRVKGLWGKFNIQGNEVEIFESSTDSFFDKYLNEVLYVFENCGADAIVFEDIDRYDEIKIFERLRETNTIVNSQLEKSGKPPLRFIYLIKDDIFHSKDRTKFFDYIIPVIPVMDNSNSYDKIMELFKDNDLKCNINTAFLNDVSLYIDDMRILKNIYNEFVIYNEKLSETDVDCNKLFAIIVYKNIFPRDFSELQLERGYIFFILSQRDFIISKACSVLEENEKAILLKRDAVYDKIKLNYSKFKNVPGLINGINYNYGNNENIKLQLKNIFNSDFMKDCEKSANGAFDEDLKSINNELLLEKSRISGIRKKTIRELLIDIDVDNFFELNDIPNRDKFNDILNSEYFNLLKYLVRNGHIDSSYHDYMTYFYPNTITVDDKKFLRSIADGKRIEFDFPLKKTSEVVERLQPEHFDRDEILNFSLLEFLLSKHEHTYFRDLFFDKLKLEKCHDFILQFTLRKGKNTLEFLSQLAQVYPEFFHEMQSSDIYNSGDFYNFHLEVFKNLSISNLEAINFDNCMSKSISENSKFIQVKYESSDAFSIKFLTLKVLFDDISIDNPYSYVLEDVIRNNLYKINFKNISCAIKNSYSEDISDEDITHKNYSIILSKKDTPLYRYVNNNISEYINAILLSCSEIINDNEDSVIELLNRDDISDELKFKYLSFLQTKISSMSSVNREFFGFLIKNNIATFSSENIYNYKDGVIDENIIRFINDSEEAFTQDIKNEETRGKFFKSIYSCNELEYEKYSEIIKKLNFYVEKFDAVGLNNDKINFLVESNIIRMTESNLAYLRENYGSSVVYFIEVNFDEYIGILGGSAPEFNETTSLLESNLTDEQKITILNLVEYHIPILSGEYSDSVLVHIIQNNFSVNDFSHIFNDFESFGINVQLSIIDSAKENIETPELYVEGVSKILIGELIKSDELELDARKQLLATHLTNFSADKLVSFFKDMGLEGYSQLFDENTDETCVIKDSSAILLDALARDGFIENFSQHDEDAELFTVKMNT